MYKMSTSTYILTLLLNHNTFVIIGNTYLRCRLCPCDFSIANKAKYDGSTHVRGKQHHKDGAYASSSRSIKFYF